MLFCTKKFVAYHAVIEEPHVTLPLSSSWHDITNEKNTKVEYIGAPTLASSLLHNDENFLYEWCRYEKYKERFIWMIL